MHFWDEKGIADRLRRVLVTYKARGVSVRELSVASGMPETYLDRIPARVANGTNVSFLFFAGLRETTGISLDWITSGSGVQGGRYNDPDIRAIKERAAEARAILKAKKKQKPRRHLRPV